MLDDSDVIASGAGDTPKSKTQSNTKATGSRTPKKSAGVGFLMPRSKRKVPAASTAAATKVRSRSHGREIQAANRGKADGASGGRGRPRNRSRSKRKKRESDNASPSSTQPKKRRKHVNQVTNDSQKAGLGSDPQ